MKNPKSKNLRRYKKPAIGMKVIFNIMGQDDKYDLLHFVFNGQGFLAVQWSDKNFVTQSIASTKYWITEPYVCPSEITSMLAKAYVLAKTMFPFYS